jgi:hypothetical protein
MQTILLPVPVLISRSAAEYKCNTGTRDAPDIWLDNSFYKDTVSGRIPDLIAEYRILQIAGYPVRYRYPANILIVTGTFQLIFGNQNCLS